MKTSERLFTKAKQYLPGGVNSPVRAFQGVGGTPLFFQSASGAYLVDVEGQRYIDYVGSWGPMVVGHTHPKVVQAVQQAASRGLSFGAPTEGEILLAEKITTCMPNLEQVRCVNSGTEATMTALRIARAATQRAKVIKFIGCYHGHLDTLLVQAGSGALTLGVPNSAGVPTSAVSDTLLAHFNDLDSVVALFKQYPEEIAAIVVEPIAGNMGCIPGELSFLQGLRKLCNDYQSLLIFDEVITGFRVALGGAQSLYQIKPDLTILGKAIGGGLPIGAVGGRRELMELLAPVGAVYQAGTLSGNPLSMAAGLATLELIQQAGTFDYLAGLTEQLTSGLLEVASAARVPMTANQVGGIFGLFFTAEPKVTRYQQVMMGNVEHFKAFFHGMLAEGIYLAPSAYEAGFVSMAHTKVEIDFTISAAQRVLSTLE